MKNILLVIFIISSNIYSQNTPPVAQNQSVNTTKGTVKEITLVATDIDNDVLTYVIKTLPQNGNLKDGNTTITQSDLPRILGSSTLKYIPAAGFSGNDSFTFVARDLSIASFAAANGLTIINNNGEPVTYNKPAGKTYFLIGTDTLQAVLYNVIEHSRESWSSNINYFYPTHLCSHQANDDDHDYAYKAIK